MNFDTAMDFGSANVKMYLEGKGVAVNEPSFIAVDQEADEVLGTGREAYQMLGRAAKRIVVESPFSSGVVTNFPMAEYVVGRYVKRISAGRLFLPNALVCLPEGLSAVERHALQEVIETSGIRKISFIREPAAAALGAGLDIFDSKASMVVDMGAAKTTAAIFSSGRMLHCETVSAAGNEFDDKIIRCLRAKYALAVGKLSGEELKLELGSAIPREKTAFAHVRGLDLTADLPKDVVVTSDDLVTALQEPVEKIIDCIQGLLSGVSASVLGDIAEKGISLVGGSSRIYGMDNLVWKKTGIRVNLIAHPEEAVVTGAGMALKSLGKDQLRAVLIMAEETA